MQLQSFEVTKYRNVVDSVWILGNVIDNPRAQGDQLFSIAEPFSGPGQ